jgi:hypothetical protein
MIMICGSIIKSAEILVKIPEIIVMIAQILINPATQIVMFAEISSIIAGCKRVSALT